MDTHLVRYGLHIAEVLFPLIRIEYVLADSIVIDVEILLPNIKDACDVRWS